MQNNNNIIYDSYYLVNLFTKDNKEVTQIQIQKLLYFFEAYYMNVNDTDKLYDCNFNAWMFGPVALPLYEEYNHFGEYPIHLEEKQIELGENISNNKKRLLKQLYDVFGKLEPEKLVELTTMCGSSWYDKWVENDEKMIYGSESYIDKTETKKWFKENFISNEA